MESELLESCHSLTHWRKYLERLFSYFSGGKKPEYEISIYQDTRKHWPCPLSSWTGCFCWKAWIFCLFWIWVVGFAVQCSKWSWYKTLVRTLRWGTSCREPITCHSKLDACQLFKYTWWEKKDEFPWYQSNVCLNHMFSNPNAGFFGFRMFSPYIYLIFADITSEKTVGNI